MSIPTAGDSASTNDTTDSGTTQVVTSSPASSDHSDAGEHSSLGDRITAAFDRATASKELATKTTTEDDIATGQAATGDSTNSDSTNPQAGKGEASGDSDSPKNEPMTAPDNWPEDRKNAFNSIEPKGQALIASFYDDMIKGLNKSQAKLAEAREAMKSNFGAEPEAIQELIETAKTFESDPVTVLAKLADQAGVDIFFSSQGEPEIPTFESLEDQTRWLLKEQDRRSNQAKVEADKAQAIEKARADQEKVLMEQFAEAHRQHPDLSDHRDSVVEKLTMYQVPVEEAYRLATYDGLKAIADQAAGYKADLEKALAEVDRLKKASTVPPRGGNGEQHQPARARSVGLYAMVEDAMARADRRLAKK